MGDNLLTHGDIRKKILSFMFPILIGQLFQQLYNTADTLIVGNYLGAQALGAVSSTGSLIYLVIGFFLGFASGAGVIIARHIGAGDEKQTSLAVHTAFSMGLVFSVLSTLFGLYLADDILVLMKTPADIMPQAELYLKIYFAGSTSVVMYNFLVGIVQASGDSKYPLYCLVCSSILNVILDIMFISRLHMGVDGAALATVIAQFFSMFLVLYRLLKAKDTVRLAFTKLGFDLPNMKAIVRYGLPTAMQVCVIDLSNVLIQSYVNSFGSAAVAGIGASNRAEGFAFLPVNAFSTAVTTFISQNLGAGERERARKGMVFTLVTSVVMVQTVGIIMFIFAPKIIAAFNSSPDVIVFGTQRMRIASAFFFLVGFSHVCSAVMRGAGRPNVPMIVMLACWCAVRVLVLMTVGRVVHNILLICWLYPFTWALSSVVYLFYLKQTYERIGGRRS